MDVINFLIFLALAGVIILSSLFVVLAPRIIYSVFAAIVCFMSVAGIFLQLNADFISASQVVIYGVGISILFIFAVMLTPQSEEKHLWIAMKPRTLIALGSAGALFLLTVFCITGGGENLTNSGCFDVLQPSQEHIEILKTQGTTKLIGNKLFVDYVLPFEILSLLLLIGILGAGVLASREE